MFLEFIRDNFNKRNYKRYCFNKIYGWKSLKKLKFARKILRNSI